MTTTNESAARLATTRLHVDEATLRHWGRDGLTSTKRSSQRARGRSTRARLELDRVQRPKLRTAAEASARAVVHAGNRSVSRVVCVALRRGEPAAEGGIRRARDANAALGSRLLRTVHR